jgi:hypothetical protein
MHDQCARTHTRTLFRVRFLVGRTLREQLHRALELFYLQANESKSRLRMSTIALRSGC